MSNASSDWWEHPSTAWAHMLGFRGYFSAKSRAYSITLGSGSKYPDSPKSPDG